MEYEKHHKRRRMFVKFKSNLELNPFQERLKKRRRISRHIVPKPFNLFLKKLHIESKERRKYEIKYI